MIAASTWLAKLILAHLLTDFVLQPSGWVRKRKEKHFAAPSLYLHGLLTGLMAWILTGWAYWPVALVILVTHTLIDGWKSYRPVTPVYFLIDQGLHLAVIAGCWLALFGQWKDIELLTERMNGSPNGWVLVVAFVFVTSPSGILIGQLTGRWSKKIDDPENSLASAGKWIGIAERVIVLILVLQGQYSAIGLLVTAKGIIRFNEKDRQEAKTEYLVIGTLLSIGIAIITGMIVKISLMN